jgi:hypothetical protein
MCILCHRDTYSFAICRTISTLQAVSAAQREIETTFIIYVREAKLHPGKSGYKSIGDRQRRRHCQMSSSSAVVIFPLRPATHSFVGWFDIT